MKVLLLESIHSSSYDSLTAAGIEIISLVKSLDEEELIAQLEGVALLGIRSKTKVTRRVLEAHKDTLLAIGCFCIGTNQVDLKSANEFGTPVFNAPFANTRSVAELVICEIIALGRQLFDRSSECHRGDWKKTATGCFEVRGKTLGIVGYGHIGSQLGVLAESLGMRVQYYDHMPKLAMGNNRSVATLDELLSSSDFVTLHVPETPETTGMLGAKQLARMRKGSFLLNLSRGTVVDLEALAERIKSKDIAGCAIDVYPVEPEENGEKLFVTPLQGLGNVILTPHVGGSTMEAQCEIGKEVGHALAKFITTGSTIGAVNFPETEPCKRRPNFHRIINIHRNVPGVMRKISNLVDAGSCNIRGNTLATDDTIALLIMDVDAASADDLATAIGKLEESVHTRLIARKVM